MPKTQLSKLITKLIHFDLVKLAFLLPIFFLPITTDFFDFNKKALLVLAASFVLILWLVRNILTGVVRIRLTPGLLPLAALTLASLLSLLVASPNKPQAFTGRPLIYLALLVLYAAITTITVKRQQVKNLVCALATSASVLGFISILQYFGLLTKLFPSAPPWLAIPVFTPAGSYLALLLLLIPVLVLSLFSTLSKKLKAPRRALYALGTILIAAGIVLTIISNTQTRSIILLPFSTATAIATQTLGSAKTALVGHGPGGFLNAFTSLKPQSFNTSEVWELRFTSSRNEPLHLLTTTGLLGLAAYAWLLITVVKSSLPALENPGKNLLNLSITLSLVATVVLQFLFPTGTLGLSLFVILLALSQLVSSKETKEVAIKNDTFAWILGLPLIVAIVGVLLIGITRFYSAETTFKRSLDAATLNRGTQTYNLQVEAIQKNPKATGYLSTYALTNLALANSVADQPNVGPTERENIAQLIQQSIREAKRATELDPESTAAWETLATIYRNLVGIAQGSDQWAIASFVKAIETDPVNPRLRLDLGSIYFGIGDFDQAISIFEQAGELKPDWANVYFNLSAAYREKGDLDQAITQMQRVLSLVETGSTDADLVQRELDLLQETRLAPPADTPPPEASSELSEPAPLPSPVPESQQVPLPPGLAPQVSTPSASPGL